MDEIFTMHGIPDSVMTDNGPPFNGKQFAQFAESSGFKHRKVTPLHPEANGQAEAFMKSLGKTIRTAMTEGKDWKKALNDFLKVYI